jgi:hypothetical protein
MNDTSALQQAIATLVAEWTRDAGAPQGEVPKWILPPQSCAFLIALCRALPKPVSAFEFGSGCSTHALRTACDSVISIEDSHEWLAKTEASPNAVAKRPSDITGVIPLTKCWNRFRPIESFDIVSNSELLASLRSAGLILVDSPPNPAKREHALFQALENAREGAVVVIDDLDVGATGRFCARLARQNRSTLAYWELPFDHRLGVFLKLKVGTIRSWPTIREIVGAWMRL